VRNLNKPSKELVRSKRRQADGYGDLLDGVVRLVESSRVASIRAVNTILTSTYWLVGQRIVEHEQSGEIRAGYGQELLKRLAADLTGRLGRGFSERNLEQMRLFYLGWRTPQTVSAKSHDPEISQTLSAKFPLPWSHYVRLMTVANLDGRRYYEQEALRSGWSVRQLDRQIATLAYERTKGTKALRADEETQIANAEIRDPFILEFLNLKDEYSESDLENALIGSLEQFLLELGSDFAFVARQKRLRVGTEWYRVDLLFFHRHLRCLVIVDLKLGKFTHSDAGQMNLYLNYAREHWTHPHENPPVGLILCSEKDASVARYALGNLSNKVLAREYQLALPDEGRVAELIDKTRRVLAGGDH
jgi:predicted nuclease of restriction endonuclease-like (RecB) superfamily